MVKKNSLSAAMAISLNKFWRTGLGRDSIYVSTCLIIKHLKSLVHRKNPSTIITEVQLIQILVQIECKTPAGLNLFSKHLTFMFVIVIN